MKIQFHNILPTPLKDYPHAESSIWGKEIIIEQGQKVMLNASSGKGKTTFTHLLYGLRQDYSGKLLLNNKEQNHLSPKEWTLLRQREISVVFQDLQLFPNLTVQENLKLKNQLTKVYTEEQIHEMLNVLGIGDKWQQQLGLLSMGQQQRVAIIRALCQPFSLLIMDEPFSHLDVENTALCLELINKRCDELGAGFILTSLGDTHKFQYDQTLYL